MTLTLLYGDRKGRPILSLLHIWTLFTTINLTYAVASTSWLLYWAFTALCYPVIYITCLFQYETVGAVTRWILRRLLNYLHFIDDKIAMFDIPALEIDTEVEGLMVLRGISLSLSTLSLTVHGVEVGIKLSDDLELAIQTEQINISLFRSIEVGECFANIKSGKQASFMLGTSEPKSSAAVAAGAGATSASTAASSNSNGDVPEISETKARMTAGNPPQDSSRIAAYKDIKKQTLHSDIAVQRYHNTLKMIEATNTVNIARTYLRRHLASTDGPDNHDEPALLAGICAQLHSKPTIPNPPRRSIKVTVLRQLLSPAVRRFLHRLPMLLRLLLNPLSYLHPVSIRSITMTAPGDQIKSLLLQTALKKDDSSDVDLYDLRESILSWVTEAHFTVGLGRMAGQASVPLLPSSNILCQLAFDSLVAHRALATDMRIYEIVKLSGLDASFIVPTFLLPHHEHIIPNKTDLEAKAKPTNGQAVDVTNSEDADEPSSPDRTVVKTAVRAHLPGTLDQDILDFIALLVKHAKLLEMDQMPGPMDADVKRFSEVTGALNQKVKNSVKKLAMGGDMWLARLAGKVLTKLQVLEGDVGYSGDIPVELWLVAFIYQELANSTGTEGESQLFKPQCI